MAEQSDRNTIISDDDATTFRNRQAIKELVIDLRDRANHFEKMAYICAFLVTLCIFGGIYIFWYSDKITDQFRQSLLTKLSDEFIAERQNIQLEEHAISANRAEISVLQKYQKPTQTKQPSVSSLSSSTNDLQPIIHDANEQRIIDLTMNIQRSQDRIKSSEQNLKQIENRRTEIYKKPDEEIALAITTKVGSVLLLLFFLRVLVSIFRYYSRLASFFQSRSDAINCYQAIPELKITEFSDFIFPGIVDFEKSVENQEIPGMALAKELITTKK